MRFDHAFRCARRSTVRAVVLTVLAGAFFAAPAWAQLDPLSLVKRTTPNILFVVDTSSRMQWDGNGNYYDPTEYLVGNMWDQSLTTCPQWQGSDGQPLSTVAGTRYRRIYTNLLRTGSGGFDFSTARICVRGDRETVYGRCVSSTHSTSGNPGRSCGFGTTTLPLFYQETRLGVAKGAMLQALAENRPAARFGLVRMRQDLPVLKAQGPVASQDSNQILFTDGSSDGWNVWMGAVSRRNSQVDTACSPASPTICGLIQANGGTAASDISTALNRSLTTAGAMIAAGADEANFVDAPLARMIEDARTEAARLIGLDAASGCAPNCRNTVVVVFAGGGEGTTPQLPTAASIAANFTNVGGRRVPIYVIGIAPPDTEVAQLKAIADASGGQYFHVSAAQISRAAERGIPVPEAVMAVNTAIQHAFANTTDVNTAPTASLPYGPRSEFQATSPVVGTVDLYRARFADGTMVPDAESRILSATGTELPQRSNLMVTSGIALPGHFQPFDAASGDQAPQGRGGLGWLRGFRVYKPVPDSTKPSGYKFVADGKALWVASPPLRADGTVDDIQRNIFTVHPTTGAMIPFTPANAAILAPWLRQTRAGDPGTVLKNAELISFIRRQPIGAILGSTPAVLDAPSIDPAPDADYPAFIEANKDRRTLIIVGANDGMVHAFDARTGIEVWAFIPFNLLPKLETLRDGQGIDGFGFFVDSSPKVADVRVDHDGDGDTEWRTYLYIGQGPGGTFYQAFDVTLDGLAQSGVDPVDDVSELLAYLSDANRIRFRWAFPRYSTFDSSVEPYGEVSFAAPYNATSMELSVGQTWSDPAVGQAVNQYGRYILLTGSGFLSRSQEQTWHRNGVAAGTSFYMLDAGTGQLLDGEMVPSDNFGENVSNCAAAGDCRYMKNALQADPVATGPPDSRFITKAYIGDLDGNVWRFDLTPGTTGAPTLSSEALLFAAGRDHPLFASMAAVTVGTQQYLFFGSGSDLLPSNGVNNNYKLFGLLEGSNQPTFTRDLEKVDNLASDEKVSAFPAVAGDIVFFTTTSFKPQSPWLNPDANLYAFTFIGGAAYDSSGDDRVLRNESPKVQTLAAAGRATAPFIVDQHLWFGAGNKVSVFGDSQDFNNGVGQVGVRILSWRQLR